MQTLNMKHRSHQTEHPRKGGVLVLAAGLLILIFVFAAFTVDLGLISVTKGQLQNAADSAAHSAAMELQHSFGAGAQLTNTQARTVAELEAKSIATAHRSGDMTTTPFDTTKDIRFGHRQWDADKSEWEILWDTTPYNVSEVRLRRARANGTSLPLSFAQLLGSDDAEVQAKATAAIMPGVGFGPPGGNPNDSDDTYHTVDLLPFTIDLGTWDAFMTVYTSGSWAHVPKQSNFMYCFAQGNGTGTGTGTSAAAAAPAAAPVRDPCSWITCTSIKPPDR